ncbi:TPA: hypothetical protein N2B29_006390 [Pseudomonas aeruginosa]|uniref:P-type conjugative transfer protein TrbJ n=2 Tax=Pseudomonas aeruginosa TaxID=287 RepID=A0A5E5R9Y1_PSEAI|nr:hypothetical protein [Pseudomonas aeruginosa]KSI50883.1 hypothetical protein AO983_21020 [Pseudomonas aeruginosa]MCZ7786906.1 hypothetical protein [Pseudomonas aeruginosa]MZZ17699.1 hypothetical protein [Pseudomonas aeruginosa]OKR83827.1 hypothetical protein BH601_09110 [Pseudomonas aeruginosa]RQH75411.1 hypothetical protein IPC25_29900 [Pseudomonas aeruginosa]
MKRKLKPLAIAVFLSMATMTNSSVVNAWGFPVADIANLTQMVEGYIQDLKNYDEYIQTTVLNQEQLAEALRLYKQTLVAYDEVLRQMESLKRKLSPRDWKALFASYKDILDLYPTQTQRSDAEWERINAKVDQVYARGQKMVELQSIVDAIPFKGNGRETVASDLNRAITRSDLAVSQSNTVEKFNQKLKDNMEDLTYLDENRLSLGDEDNLRTLQFLAEQNQKALELQVESMAQSNSRMLFSNQLASHVFSKDKENQEASLKELEQKRKQKIKVDNSPLANW